MCLNLTCACCSGETDAPWSIASGSVSKYTDSVGCSWLQSTDDEGLGIAARNVHDHLVPTTSLDKEPVAADDSIAYV